MTKRKATTPSKPARRPKIAAKAQRANAIRSPKPNRVRTAPQDHDDPKQKASIAARPATALQDPLERTMEPQSKKGFELSSATATARAYQAKLLEMAQANMQLAIEYAQRLATMRSPFELPGLVAEFTSKRIAMFRKHSAEMVKIGTNRAEISTSASTVR